MGFLPYLLFQFGLCRLFAGMDLNLAIFQVRVETAAIAATATATAIVLLVRSRGGHDNEGSIETRSDWVQNKDRAMK
jgi:hypothetical protein